MDTIRILVVEDEFITAAALKVSLEGMGFVVAATADTGEGAIKLASDLHPDIVLMDIVLKGKMNGIEAAAAIQKQYEIPVIYLTGQSDEATINSALESEPFGYIIKPFDDKNLKTSIKMAMYKHAIDLKLKASEERYRTIAEFSEDGILILSSSYAVVYANNSALRILKHGAQETFGRTLPELLPETMYAEIRKIPDEVRATGKSVRRVQEYVTDVRHRWFETAGIPLGSGKDSPGQFLLIFHDITDRILMEKKLKIEGVMQIEKNMEQFQILNDQIRNPLQVITGLTLLGEGPYKEKILAQAAIIDDLVTRLDKGWIESEKVRNFLLRHYQHGGNHEAEL